MIRGTRSGYFSRINCDFLTRSKWSLDANVDDAGDKLYVVVFVVIPSLNVAYNGCSGDVYDVVS